jgi:prophage antirepressor-like protein
MLDENSKYSILCLTKNREIIYVGKDFADVLGYERESIKEKRIENILAQKSVGNEFFEPYNQNDGWRTLTLEKANHERIVTKYKVEECVDKTISQIVLFFNFSESK